MTTHPMIWLTAAIVLGLPQWLAAQDHATYCAFWINVKSPAGSPVPQAPVSAVDQSGARVGKATSNENGEAAICDVPMGLIDIHIGDNRCGAVTVHYLKPDWLRPRYVQVIYENCAGAEHIPPTGCLVTIRVRNGEGVRLSGVEFVGGSSPPGSMPQTRTSDEYGRIFRIIRFGETLTGALEKSGYISKQIAEPCRPGEAYQKERIIILGEF